MTDEQIEARAQGFRAGFQAGMSRAVEWVETHRLRVQYPPNHDAVVLRAIQEISTGIRTEMENGAIGEPVRYIGQPQADAIIQEMIDDGAIGEPEQRQSEEA